MKKRIFLTISIVFIIAMLFSGCIHQDISVKIDKNNGGTITTTIGIKKEFYNQLSKEGESPFEGLETKEYEYNGTPYIAYSETQEYSTYEKMVDALLELTYNTNFVDENILSPENSVYNTSTPTNTFDVVNTPNPTSTPEPNNNNTEQETNEEKLRIFKSITISKDKAFLTSTYRFEAVINHQEAEQDKTQEGEINTDTELGYDMSDVFRFSLSVEMPGTIIDYSNGAINGSKITFTISDITQPQSFMVTSQTNSDYIVYTAVGVLVALAILVWIVVGLSRQKEDTHGTNK